MSMTIARNISFVPYYGGKSRNLASTFAALFPPHKIYAELFGGGAGVLLNKKPAEIEIYNDLADGLVTLFRVARDPLKCQELAKQLDLTPYARSEYKACVNEYLTRENWHMLGEIEQARIVYTILQQSFGAQLGHDSGFGFGDATGRNKAATWRNNIANLPRITRRLANVQVECSNAMTLLDRWAKPETLFYLDPPYTHDSRKETRGYQHEQDNSFHERLLQKITGQMPDSMIFLSGYQSDLYSSYLGDWHLLEFAVNSAIANTQTNEKQKRVECLWINPTAWANMSNAQRGNTFGIKKNKTKIETENSHELPKNQTLKQLSLFSLEASS